MISDAVVSKDNGWKDDFKKSSDIFDTSKDKIKNAIKQILMVVAFIIQIILLVSVGSIGVASRPQRPFHNLRKPQTLILLG